jgi:hypothetical protein
MLKIKNYFDLQMPEIELPLTDIEKLGDAIRIKSTHSPECRDALFKCARFFKREFQYDAIQYASPYALENDNDCHAYIWTIEKKTVQIKSIVVGAFCFRLREWGGFGFQWIWLHPYVRNRGLLSRHWSEMENKFGKNFYCEPPYSPAMHSFIVKNSHTAHYLVDENKAPPSWQNRIII